MSHGRIWKMFTLICWLQNWLMWWKMQVIHYTIVSRVIWFLDLAACVCRDWPISFLLCSTGNQNSQCKLSERHNFHWYVICFFYSYLVCIFVSFHYVHNFQKWNNKVLLDLTWLDLIIFWYFDWVHYLVNQKSNGILHVFWAPMCLNSSKTANFLRFS